VLRLRAPVLLAVLLAALACARNPVTGRPELVLLSEGREAEIGRELAERVEREIGLVEDAPVAALVAELGRRLAVHSPRAEPGHAFRVVDLTEPNAFALPDGHVYVSRGLVALANTESELAGALAHEIGHVAARHHAQRLSRALGAGLLSLPGALLGALVGTPGEIAGAPLEWLGRGWLAAYSRAQEREADRVGQRLAAAAGYDPAALPGLLETLARAEKLLGEERRVPRFLDTHPYAAERVAEARVYAAELVRADAAPLAPGRAAFLARLEGLRVGPNPAEGVFRDGLFLHPGLMFALHFPDGWETANARTAVGAIAPEGDARLVLALQGEGDDPAAAARTLLAEFEGGLDVGPGEDLRIGALPAHRVGASAQVQGHPLRLEIWWIAYDGLVYRLVGMAPPERFAERRPAFREAAASFRPLRPSERASLRELRLRVARALAGETLAELGVRTGNAWTPAWTAVANRTGADARLGAGARVKVAIPQPLPPFPDDAQ